MQEDAPGRILMTDGSIFMGYYDKGVRHGQGTELWYPSPGDVYQGNYENGLRNGYGKYSFSNGVEYAGEWKDNKRHGHGVMKWANGD